MNEHWVVGEKKYLKIVLLLHHCHTPWRSVKPGTRIGGNFRIVFAFQSSCFSIGIDGRTRQFFRKSLGSEWGVRWTGWRTIVGRVRDTTSSRRRQGWVGLENPRKWNIPFGYWVTEGRGILEGGGGDASLLGIVTRSYLSAVPTDFREARPKVWPPISRD